MTREESLSIITEAIEDYVCNYVTDTAKAQKMLNAIQTLEQEPCEKVAQERYADLCEYFGGAKDILKNRKDFKAWLERVKWHIHKAEELYEKYEYKKEPCEDEYIKVPKKALKYRTAGMVAYNAEWLKNHFDIERVVICGAQQPCDDVISRQAVDTLVDELARAISDERGCMSRGRSTSTIMQDILDLPSVNPQEPKKKYDNRWFNGYAN